MRRLFLLAVASILMLAGCGGGSGEEPQEQQSKDLIWDDSNWNESDWG